MVMICRDCGTVGKTHDITKGSIAIEIILWLCFLIPGLIYSMWRINSRYEACAVCNSVNLVPLDSPVGASLAKSTGYLAQKEPKRDTSKAESFGRLVGQLFAKR